MPKKKKILYCPVEELGLLLLFSIYHIRFFHCIGLLAYGKIIWSWWPEVCADLCNWPQKNFHLVFLMLSCIMSNFGVEKSIFWMKGSIAKANSLGQTFCDLHTCLHLFYCSSNFFSTDLSAAAVEPGQPAWRLAWRLCGREGACTCSSGRQMSKRQQRWREQISHWAQLELCCSLHQPWQSCSRRVHPKRRGQRWL